MRFFTPALCVLFLLILTNLDAQLVNIEKSRKDAKQGFQGHIDMNLMLTRNTRQIMETGTTAHLQYTSGKHTLLALNNLGFMRVEGENLINNGFQHLRYNYKIGNGFTTAEAFTQHQYNSIRLLQRRFLLGGGPRFRVFENESTGFYIAPLVMYEQEELNDGSPRTDRFKGDLYFSFTYSPDERITFSHTTYYQPDFAIMREYRIASETGMEMKFMGSFSFLITYNLAFDSHPPADIPELFYTLRNGIKYSF
jgi:hypothetical protein